MAAAMTGILTATLTNSCGTTCANSIHNQTIGGLSNLATASGQSIEQYHQDCLDWHQISNNATGGMTNWAVQTEYYWQTTPAVAYSIASYNVIVGSVTYNQYGYYPAETAEERVEREKQEAVAAKVAELAAQRAEVLLLSLLNDDQRKQYTEKKHFDVAVGTKIYRLSPYDRVRLMESGQTKIAYCIHPDHKFGLPAADVMIAQKFLLETDEAHFLKTANATVYPTHGLPTTVVVAPPIVMIPDALAEAELIAFAA